MIEKGAVAKLTTMARPSWRMRRTRPREERDVRDRERQICEMAHGLYNPGDLTWMLRMKGGQVSQLGNYWIHYVRPWPTSSTLSSKPPPGAARLSLAPSRPPHALSRHVSQRLPLYPYGSFSRLRSLFTTTTSTTTSASTTPSSPSHGTSFLQLLEHAFSSAPPVSWMGRRMCAWTAPCSFPGYSPLDFCSLEASSSATPHIYTSVCHISRCSRSVAIFFGYA